MARATSRTVDPVDIHQCHRSNDFSSSTQYLGRPRRGAPGVGQPDPLPPSPDPLPPRPESTGSAQRALLEVAEERWWRYAGVNGGEKRERKERRGVHVQAGRPGCGFHLERRPCGGCAGALEVRRRQRRCGEERKAAAAVGRGEKGEMGREAKLGLILQTLRAFLQNR